MPLDPESGKHLLPDALRVAEWVAAHGDAAKATIEEVCD